MDWSDILKLALSIFLIVTGVALAFVFFRLAGVFQRLGLTVTRITDEVIPILSKAHITMDGVNREIDRVDEIMLTAVHGAKGAEKTVTTVSNAVTTPVRKLSGLAAGLKEATATFQARRRAEALDRATAPAAPVPAVVPDVAPAAPAAVVAEPAAAVEAAVTGEAKS